MNKLESASTQEVMQYFWGNAGNHKNMGVPNNNENVSFF